MTRLGIATPEHYDAQLERKCATIENDFAPFYRGELTIHPSPPAHFRMRAEFRIWHQDGIAAYAMYEPGKYKQVQLIKDFSIGAKPIVAMMAPLLSKINSSELLSKRLFQVEFLSTSTGEVLVTLIYHKTLGEDWEQEAKNLQQDLACMIIGRSRGQKLVLSRDYVVEQFSVQDKSYRYQQIETGFTQPNAFVCEKMLNWAVTQSQHFGGDLLELYCGNANFTLPLASNFRKVLATEVAKISVKSALFNMQNNAVKNIDVVRLSSEEFCEAYARTREFRRLKHIELDDYDFTTIFVDPPRAGLDQHTMELCRQFDHILYVSCNPQTLRENLETLCLSHEVKQFALFDQFPYTDHIECGVYLQRR